MNEKEIKDFLEEYNNILSMAALEHKGNFAALASPTLNKQETITFLYQNVCNQIPEPTTFLKSFKKDFVLLFFLSRLIYVFVKLIHTSFRFRVKSLPMNAIYIRTWLVPRSLQNSKVHDDYFRKLIEDLEKEQTVIVGFQPLDYGKLLNKFRKVEKPENFIIPIGLLNILEIISLLFNYITTAKIKLHKQYFYKGKDICRIINNSITKDYYNLRSFQAYLELFIAEKIKKFKPKIFLYIFENQAWENAYVLKFKGSNTTTIGYQSSGFSFRFLNFFPSQIDSQNSLFPDKILTVGNLYTETLKKYGHYPISIETFAALRFDYPVENEKYKVQHPVDKIHKRILYAFPVHYYQYAKIITDLSEVFGDSEIEVHLKYHPLYNEHAINLKLPPNFKVWSTNSKKRLNEIYDLVLSNDNSFGIESLIEGVKSYEYDFGELHHEKRLINFDCYNATLNKKNLYLIKEQLKSNEFVKHFNHEDVSNYINKIYKPYNSSLIKLII